MRHVTRRGAGEDGNIIIAVMIIMIVTLLAVAATLRSISALHSVRQEQDFSAALARADAGVSDALFRIDQNGTAPASSFCVGTPPAGATFTCAGPTVAGASNVEYDAHRVDDSTYQVTALGTVNGRPHAIQATVTRTGLFPFALFGTGNLTFNGNGTGTIQSVDGTGAAVSPSIANVGSAGTVTCNSGSSDGAHQVSYQHSYNNCPSPTSPTSGYTPADPVTAANCPSPNTNVPMVPCAPSSALACPATGAFGPGVLTGTYLCTTSVSFTGPITVSGGFHLYVIPPAGQAANVDLSTNTTCSVTNWTGASPACGINVAGCTASPSYGPCGDPTQFSIDVAGAGSLILGQGSNVPTLTGTIYAPSIAVTKVNGCQIDITGALVVNAFTCGGAPNQEINYSTLLQSERGENWTVSQYHEIPSSQFVLSAS